MNHVILWVLISLAVGLMAGLITAIFSHHGKKQGPSQGLATAEADQNDLDEIEGSHSGNILFVILVFAVLAFLIVWLIMAITTGDMD